MLKLISEEQTAAISKEQLCRQIAQTGISIERRCDFASYTAIRRAHGDRHLNQAFDPLHVTFGKGDFWLLAENEREEEIATYCLRRFIVRDFFDLIRSLELWFSPPPHSVIRTLPSTVQSRPLVVRSFMAGDYGSERIIAAPRDWR